jgi:2-polyprenyl-3-methyl-5-hydroxy-6-metoxy-1,4-benzoquinol methylase
MSKFTSKQNQNFWDIYAKTSKNSKLGAHHDSNLVYLENEFILSILKKHKFNSLLDIGCGNGQRTSIFSKYVKKTLGVDYSKNMIAEANLMLNKNKPLQKKLSFEQHNIQEFSDSRKFDVIISCRCFINQTSYKNQINLFKKLHIKLNKGGCLILAEISQEGVDNLNLLRKKHGLKNTKPKNSKIHNLFINESKVFPIIKKSFKINNIRRGGIFYYISRIIHPTLVFPLEPTYGAKINKIAISSEMSLRSIFKNNSNSFEKYGEHLLAHLIKK